MPAPCGCASRWTRARVCGNAGSNFVASTPVKSAIADANGASANGVAVACSDSAASRSVPLPAMPICAAVPRERRRRLRACQQTVAGDRRGSGNRQRLLRTHRQIACRACRSRTRAAAAGSGVIARRRHSRTRGRISVRRAVPRATRARRWRAARCRRRAAVAGRSAAPSGPSTASARCRRAARRGRVSTAVATTARRDSSRRRHRPP